MLTAKSAVPPAQVRGVVTDDMLAVLTDAVRRAGEGPLCAAELVLLQLALLPALQELADHRHAALPVRAVGAGAVGADDTDNVLPFSGAR